GRGGVNRQALSIAEGEARSQLLEWSETRGFKATVDAIGNLFIRREGTDRYALPVVAGSHLDSQPTGGNFDGVFGVLAALEVMETIDEHRLATQRPLELVVWTNEEGSRFQPTTMGSAVYAGAFTLEKALAAKDRDGISVAEALAEMAKFHKGATSRPLGQQMAAYIENHIEQGPRLEESQRTIGVVSAVQGLKQFSINIRGEEAHAGTTPLRQRKDALQAALDLAHSLRGAMTDANDILRYTIGRFEAFPGSPNTVPSRVTFTIDLRHPDNAELNRRSDQITALCRAANGICSVELRELLRSAPVQFDPAVVDTIRGAAQSLSLPSLDMVSGATHDAAFVAGHCPSGMIIVPCRGGISHNETEFASSTHLANGTRVLSLALLKLAGPDFSVDDPFVENASIT
ncbi:MAG: M20 family metallo-hydrolase, partial [Pseudolabrys sp.]